MWEETYQLDLTTIVTLMMIGFFFGFMMGKKFMQMRVMFFMLIIFIVGTAMFLQTATPH